jgi:hypothetical protein
MAKRIDPHSAVTIRRRAEKARLRLNDKYMRFVEVLSSWTIVGIDDTAGAASNALMLRLERDGQQKHVTLRGSATGIHVHWESQPFKA